MKKTGFYIIKDSFFEDMQQEGINVITKAEVEEQIAVIDEELVWHGGMNLLGKVDIWDNLIRIKIIR